MSELKACPFCDFPAYIRLDKHNDYQAECTGCGMHTDLFARSEHAVIEYWNYRVTETKLRAELARLNVEIKTTDDLLKEATETIGAVIACCTYNSNDDAKIGIYGIDHKAFTKIDQFITHYNDAVSAGKVSVDVKTLTDNNKGEEND